MAAQICKEEGRKAFGRKKTAEPQDEKKSAAEYYHLHTDAVRDLVEANEENSPKVSEEELRKYRSRKGIHLSNTVRSILIKWWFCGAACFFFFWGIGFYVGNTLDQMVVLGIALGIMNDILVNNALRFFAKTPGANDAFMMYPKKKYVSFFLNIIHSGVVLFLVFWVYNLVNILLNALMGTPDGVHFGVEPVFFGLIYVGMDLLIITMKRTMQHIVADAMRKAR